MPPQNLPPQADLTKIRQDLTANGTWAHECGERIRRRRQEKGYSLEAVARAAGISFVGLSRLETGDRLASDAVKVAVAFVLNVEVSDLWVFPTRDQTVVRLAS